MMLTRFGYLRIMACLAVVFAAVSARALAPSATPSMPARQATAGDAAIPAKALLQPKELEQLLRSSGAEKPLILQVGSRVLYAEAHIPGSQYAGAAGDQAGLQALQDRVRALKRNSFLVIYCGCCPWNMCPNIRPAYRKLRALGFTNLKVLYLADNFGADWVDKGYPVVRGQ